MNKETADLQDVCQSLTGDYSLAFKQVATEVAPLLNPEAPLHASSNSLSGIQVSIALHRGSRSDPQIIFSRSFLYLLKLRIVYLADVLTKVSIHLIIPEFFHIIMPMHLNPSLLQIAAVLTLCMNFCVSQQG